MIKTLVKTLRHFEGIVLRELDNWHSVLKGDVLQNWGKEEFEELEPLAWQRKDKKKILSCFAFSELVFLTTLWWSYGEKAKRGSLSKYLSSLFQRVLSENLLMELGNQCGLYLLGMTALWGYFPGHRLASLPTSTSQCLHTTGLTYKRKKEELIAKSFVIQILLKNK